MYRYNGPIGRPRSAPVLLVVVADETVTVTDEGRFGSSTTTVAASSVTGVERLTPSTVADTLYLCPWVRDRKTESPDEFVDCTVPRPPLSGATLTATPLTGPPPGERTSTRRYGLEELLEACVVDADSVRVTVFVLVVSLADVVVEMVVRVSVDVSEEMIVVVSVTVIVVGVTTVEVVVDTWITMVVAVRVVGLVLVTVDVELT
jgi:hypothetical protein